jgi:hypothetical protein
MNSEFLLTNGQDRLDFHHELRRSFAGVALADCE